MTPEDLARRNAAHLGEPEARKVAAAEFAARQLGGVMFQQHGVVSLKQLRAAGLEKHDVERLLRYRELRRVHRRVYVDHTGVLTADQRIWAAVLAASPAVVCGPTLLSPGADGPVHIAVEGARAIGVDRLCEALARRTNLRRRAFVAAVLVDVAQGAQSVLEWGYLNRVERAHGLPAASRQVLRRTAGGNQFRDIEYDAFGLVVELDGWLGHHTWDAQARDADRDLDDVAAGKLAIRLRWRQVFGTPCQTAMRLALVLQARGWTGTLRRCPDCS